jgi:hypothetical protein
MVLSLDPAVVQRWGKATPAVVQRWGKATTDKGATTEDVDAENVLLSKQLLEAHLLVLHAAHAQAVVSDVDAEAVLMQNRELLTTVKKLREENAILLERQQEMELAIEELQTRQVLEQIVEENVELQGRLETTTGHVLILLDDIENLKVDIKNLKVQLSKQRRKCNDAEEQRDAQKQLFLKLFMMVKHDTEQNNTQHAQAVKHAILEDYLRIAAKGTASPLDNRNEVARVPSTEEKLEGNLTDMHGTQASKHVFAEHNCDLAAPGPDGKAPNVPLPHLSPSSPVHRAKQNVNGALAESPPMKFRAPYAAL